MKNQLQELLLSILEQLEVSGSSGSVGKHPNFDNYADDFLEMAELDLQAYGKAQSSAIKQNALMSCLANLKRALDCQVECFLEWWGLRSSFSKKNLGLDTKLAFLTEVGVLRTRTIKRFTETRNKFEHDFKRPQIKDLDGLFDLVTALVLLLQNGMSDTQGIEFIVWDKSRKQSAGYFGVEYDKKKQCITADYQLKEEKKVEFVAHLRDYETFAYFFRVLFVLNKWDKFTSYARIRSQLVLRFK